MLNKAHNSVSYDISFVILTWNSEKYIKECIRSYAASIERENLTAEFMVVDNGSSDNTVAELEKNIFPNLPSICEAKLYKLKKNQGTTVSRNLALRDARGKFVVICDSDTEYLYGKWRNALTFIERNKKIGILAPCLMYPDGTIQPSVKKFPTIIDKCYKLWKIFFNFNIKNSDFFEDFPWDVPTTVDSAISACWILSKESFKIVGFLDEKIFYSPEDVDYCLRMWKKHKSIVYYPELKIKHITQQISHRKPLSLQSISHLFGLFYYFHKHKYCFSRDKLINNFGIKANHVFE